MADHRATYSNPAQSSCAGKYAFDTYGLANEVAKRHRDDRGYKPYKCCHCWKYHVGPQKRAMKHKAPAGKWKTGGAPRRVEDE